jgi:hypothetical protein
MVETDPVLCGLVNGYVGIFVVLNFRNKCCVSYALCYLLYVAYLCMPLSRVLDLGFLVIYYSN